MAVVLAGLGWPLLSAADTHIFVGAAGEKQGDKATFSNGFLFDATKNTYYLPQILRTNGLNKGYYRGDALTFSALPATIPNGGPIQGHAAFGARLAVQVVSVSGPPGGSFGFWEGDGESDLGILTFSVPVGTTNGSDYLVVSENGGEPGTDPYGHIHGREFTTTLPGTYLVGLRAIDLSTNGLGGGPIHAPSDVFLLRFQAGLRIDGVQAVSNKITFSFRSPPAISNVLEASSSPVAGPWLPVGLPLRGNNNQQFLTDTNPPTGNRFYRLRLLNNLP